MENRTASSSRGTPQTRFTDAEAGVLFEAQLILRDHLDGKGAMLPGVERSTMESAEAGLRSLVNADKERAK